MANPTCGICMGAAGVCFFNICFVCACACACFYADCLTAEDMEQQRERKRQADEEDQLCGMELYCT